MTKTLIHFAVTVSLICLLCVKAYSSVSIHRLSMGTTLTASSEVCAFCHTPTGNKQFNMQQPGWEKMPADAGSQFNSIPLFSTSLDNSQVGSVSIVCLSCHDGVQAPDVNSPIPIQFGLDAKVSPVNRFVASPVHQRGATYSGSHPVSVPYGAQRAELLNPESEISFDLKRKLTFKRTEKSVVNDIPVWWMETGEPGRQKNDIQLYTRISNGSVEPIPFVECSSCHDPHGSTQFLLRLQEDQRRLCVGCHNL